MSAMSTHRRDKEQCMGRGWLDVARGGFWGGSRDKTKQEEAKRAGQGVQMAGDERDKDTENN